MKKLLTTVLVRVGLAVVFAVIVISLYWVHFQWDFSIYRSGIRFADTFVYTVCVVFIYLLLFSAIIHPLKALYADRRIPFFQDSIEKLIQLLRTLFSKLGSQFVFWGILMALLVGVAWDSGLLRDKDFKLNQVPVPWTERTRSRDTSHVVILHYASHRDTPVDYLRSCATIARDLKVAGAKALLIPLTYMSQDDAKDFLEEFRSTGIAVIGEWVYMREFEGSRVGQITADVRDYQRYRSSLIQVIHPLPDPKYPYWQYAPDVSLEVLRLYYDISPKEQILRDGNEIVLGQHRYPVSEAGWMYVGNLDFRELRSGVSARRDLQKRSVTGRGTRVQYGHWDNDSAAMNWSDDIRDLAVFDGKIVILRWYDLGGIRHLSSDSESFYYARLIDQMVRGNVLRYWRYGSLLISLLSIIGCGLILYRMRLAASVAIMILFFGIVLYGSAWLFQAKGILVDIPVILASLVVSAAVFTVLRLGNEWTLGFAPPPIVRPVMAPEPKLSAPGLSLFRRKMSLSPGLAAGIVILLVIATALITSGIEGRKPVVPQKEVVDVPTLPVVEVQGLPQTENSIKQ